MSPSPILARSTAVPPARPFVSVEKFSRQSVATAYRFGDVTLQKSEGTSETSTRDITGYETFVLDKLKPFLRWAMDFSNPTGTGPILYRIVAHTDAPSPKKTIHSVALARKESLEEKERERASFIFIARENVEASCCLFYSQNGALPKDGKNWRRNVRCVPVSLSATYRYIAMMPLYHTKSSDQHNKNQF